MGKVIVSSQDCLRLKEHNAYKAGVGPEQISFFHLLVEYISEEINWIPYLRIKKNKIIKN